MRSRFLVENSTRPLSPSGDQWMRVATRPPRTTTCPPYAAQTLIKTATAYDQRTMQPIVKRYLKTHAQCPNPDWAARNKRSKASATPRTP